MPPLIIIFLPADCSPPVPGHAVVVVVGPGLAAAERNNKVQQRANKRTHPLQLPMCEGSPGLLLYNYEYDNNANKY